MSFVTVPSSSAPTEISRRNVSLASAGEVRLLSSSEAVSSKLTELPVLGDVMAVPEPGIAWGLGVGTGLLWGLGRLRFGRRRSSAPVRPSITRLGLAFLVVAQLGPALPALANGRVSSWQLIGPAEISAVNDFETFFSASTRGTRWRDRQTGLPPQNTLSMSWAVDLLLTLRELGEPGWLDPALAILDELLLYQQLWDAPFLGFDTRGGFGVMNTDAAWSDARQALFVPLLLRAYDATGKREYALRAAAALRASFTLMLVPENADVAPGNHQQLKGPDRPVRNERRPGVIS